MPASQTLAVRGLADLERAFTFAGKEFKNNLRHNLERVAEPVRADAERRAISEIRNIGEPWSEMRAVARRTLVYVAPVQRGRRSRNNPSLRRPNLATLLMDRAMQPALDAHAGEVAAEFDRLLVELGSDWQRV